MADQRETAYLAFVAAHHSRLSRTSRLLAAGDAHWAEDMVQSALTKLYVHWNRVRRADDPALYVDRMLINLFIDERRRLWRQRETVVAEITEPYAVDSVDMASRLTVLAALGELPRRQRAAIVLRYFRDLEISEVARLMGCSEGTVKSQTARGLGKLRNLIGDELEITESVR